MSMEASRPDAGEARSAGATSLAGSVSALLALLVIGCMLLVALEALFAVPLLSILTLWPDAGAAATVAGAVMVCAGIFAAVLLPRLAGSWLASVTDLIKAPPLRAWLLGMLLLGLVLRLVWVSVFPSVPASDGATYLQLAQSLASGEPYETAGTRAYWPPGYPLLLTPVVAIAGTASWGYIGLNLVLFAFSVAGAYVLGARALGSETVGRLAALLVAVWPNLVMMSSVPAKELVIVALIPWWLVAVMAVDHHGPSERSIAWRSMLGAGTLGGAAALVQPSLLLLPAVLILYDLLARRGFWCLSARLGVLLLCMALVIVPWTARNYAVFGEVVPISTNGGSNLYRANNPLATGGYVAQGEVDVESLPELESSSRGFELAVDWIVNHPTAFLELAVWKQVLFLGDDANGAYESLKRGGGTDSTATYALAKAAANAAWLGAWVLLLLLLFRRLPLRLDGFSPPLLTLFGTFLYLWALHSVFESGGRYHVPALIPLLICTGAGVVDAASRAKRLVGESDNRERPAPVLGELALFTVAGAIATLLQFVILILLSTRGGVPVVLASTIGYAAAAGLNYLLNYHLTFRASRAHGSSATRFAMVVLTGIGLNALLMALLTGIVGAPYLPAQAVTVVLVFIWNFAAHRAWSFQSGSGASVARRVQ
ncbi:MAG: hypothetical protein FKY71_07625 [Spiribacter salinus]|uniref:GtrA/DPMS transmembrane domain-containing protein n=1 Tax=Spiribacter salinus TaxID=1335746 RepID=A0A540VSH5_9GAMM|nr:MAG: hypothetical protein FKY71_07625 [Spiribacter salinus]